MTGIDHFRNLSPLDLSEQLEALNLQCDRTLDFFVTLSDERAMIMSVLAEKLGQEVVAEATNLEPAALLAGHEAMAGATEPMPPVLSVVAAA